MRTYELVVISRTSLSAEKRKKLLDGVKTLLKDVKFTKEDDWGQKVLSTPIRREKEGYYSYYAFDTVEIASDFEKRLQGQEDVLRHLLLRKK